ncbi:MAG: hypothetical protein J6U64_04850 [Alphaproteobacteria bacterium]|nr:hypothetical protein [Alphaproteobacteria bacterium]
MSEFSKKDLHQGGKTFVATLLQKVAVVIFLFCVYLAYNFFRERLIVSNTTHDVAFRSKSILTEVGLDSVPTSGYKILNYPEETEYGYPVQIYGIREQYMIPNGFVIEVHDVPSKICKKVLTNPLKDVKMRIVDKAPYRGDDTVCGEEKTVKMSFVYELPVIAVRTVVPGAVRNLACKQDSDCGECSICDSGICGDDLSVPKMGGACCDEPTGRYCCPLKDTTCMCQPAQGCR